MTVAVPDYYGQFACMADRCRHTCCAGWEIDIDEDTLAVYDSLPEPWRSRLRENTVREADGAHFRLTEDERCPFLQKNGLCELILSLGENVLCDICADHPRFRNSFTGRTELGLGLCCEAACELILLRTEPMTLIEYPDGEEEAPLSEDEQAVLDFRTQLLALAQDRTQTAVQRAGAVAAAAGCPSLPVCGPEEAAFLLTLERMEDSWGARLTELSAADALPLLPETEPWTEGAFEQLLVYLLYRHIGEAADDLPLARAQAELSLFLWALVRTLSALCFRDSGELRKEDFLEICRACSEELEYSDENPERIRAYLAAKDRTARKEREACQNIM